MTGELVRSYPASDLSLPRKYFAQRVRRTRLQSALLAEVPKDIIQLKKRLVSLEDLDSGGVHLVFEDGTAATADLVVGGDGIRSVGYRCLHSHFGTEPQARSLENIRSLGIPLNLPVSLFTSEFLGRFLNIASRNNHLARSHSPLLYLPYPGYFIVNCMVARPERPRLLLPR